MTDVEAEGRTFDATASVADGTERAASGTSTSLRCRTSPRTPNSPDASSRWFR